MNGNLLLLYDILGFKQLMKTKSPKELHDVVDTAVREANVVMASRLGQQAQLSLRSFKDTDTVLLWSRADGCKHSHHMILWAAGCNVFLNLMAAHIPIRAAVVHGPLPQLHTAKCIDELVSDPTFKEAHEHAEVHMSKSGLMGIVVGPSLSHRWSDDDLAPLVEGGIVSKKGVCGEFYLNPFLSFTDHFQEQLPDRGYADIAERRRQVVDEQAIGALTFLLNEQQRFKTDRGADPKVLRKYDKTLAFLRDCIGRKRFEEMCMRCNEGKGDNHNAIK